MLETPLPDTYKRVLAWKKMQKTLKYLLQKAKELQ